MDCYIEDAFNQVSRRIILRPLYSEEYRVEIDTAEDLEWADYSQTSLPPLKLAVKILPGSPVSSMLGTDFPTRVPNPSGT